MKRLLLVLAIAASAHAQTNRAFRGRDPVVEPLLIERGLKPAQQ